MSYKPKRKTRNNWPHGGAIGPILKYVMYLHIGHQSIKFEDFSSFSLRYEPSNIAPIDFPL